MKILGLHLLPHDGGFVILKNNKIHRYVELSKHFKIKHLTYNDFTETMFQELVNYIIGIENDFDVLCITPNYNELKKEDLVNKEHIKLFKKYILNGDIRYKEVKYYSHHLCHAASSYYTSNFDDALIVSLDGGGDGKIDFHSGEIYNSKLELLDIIDMPFGIHYTNVAHKVFSLLDFDTFKEKIEGKFMALCSIGKYKKEYKDLINKILDSNKYIGDNRLLRDLVKSKSNVYDIITDEMDLYDFSFTFQKIWIDKVHEFIKKYSNVSKNLCLSGGCFLNILLNKELTQEFNCHFIPNTDDSGLCLGAVLNYTKQKIPEIKSNVNAIQDYNILPHYKLDFDIIIHYLLKEKIIGIIRGDIEIGPRALGNRSIICDPRNKEIKDILNSKVKHREDFRPFGIIILKEHLEDFYDIQGDYPYMNMIAENKTDKLKGVLHYDNTTRIQTVTYEQNPFIYTLIKKFYEKTGIPAILNTSFNISGQPIINYIKDAYEMLNDKKIDMLVTERRIFI